MNHQIVEVLPSTELPGLEKALVEVESLTDQLAPLKTKAQSVTATSPDTYAELGAVLSEVRGIRKQGKAQFAPFDAIIDRVKTFLRTKLLVNQNACEEIEGICTGKMKDYEQRERAAAAEEQKKLNKQAEKRGEEPVSVKPALPSVAGYRKTRNFKAEFTDFDKLLKEFRTSKDKERLKFLRQFIMGNAQKLNEFARETKDDGKVMKLVPGTHAWEE